MSNQSNCISECKIFVYFAKIKNTHFFLFYAFTFTKHLHQSVYSKHLFNKIFILLYYYLSHRPNTTHLATIIKLPSHDYQTTSLHHQPTQPPSSSNQPPSSTHPNTHSTQPPPMKSKYPFNLDTINEIQISIQPSHCATRLMPPTVQRWEL